MHFHNRALSASLMQEYANIHDNNIILIVHETVSHVQIKSPQYNIIIEKKNMLRIVFTYYLLVYNNN